MGSAAIAGFELENGGLNGGLFLERELLLVHLFLMEIKSYDKVQYAD